MNDGLEGSKECKDDGSRGELFKVEVGEERYFIRHFLLF
jgi:hypothetical protein